MKTISINKKLADKLGLLSLDAVKTLPTTDDLFFEPELGRIGTHKKCKGMWGRWYFKRVKSTDKSYRELLAASDLVDSLEASLEKAKAAYDKKATVLQGKAIAGVKTRFTVYHHRDKGHNMEPESIQLKNGCVLLDFGRRFDGLWISIIESPTMVHARDLQYEFVTTDIKHDYFKRGGYDCAEKSSGYRSGEKFLDGCDEVKVMGGVRQAVPLPTPTQKAAAKRKEAKDAKEAKRLAEESLEEAKNDGTRTSVFAHRGIIGIFSPPNAEGVMARPKKDGSFGTVVKAEFVDVSTDALQLLKRIRRSGDSLGDVDIFKSNDGGIFGWIGGEMRMVNPEHVEGSREYDASILIPKKNVKVPVEFMAEVDKQLKNK